MTSIGRLASLALVLGSLYFFDADPRVLLFTFILSTVAQLLQIKLFLRWGRSQWFRSFVEERTRHPTDKETAWAASYIKQENAAKTIGTMLMLIAGLSLFAFMLAHVNQYKELDFDLATFSKEMTFALALTAIYVIESLVLRETAMNLEESEAMNVNYGSHRITILALAILFASVAIALLQSSGREISPWVIMGPLIVLKYGIEGVAARDT